MTQLVFALVVTLGGQTISTEYWSGIDTCLWYAKRLNSQHTTSITDTTQRRASTRSVYPAGRPSHRRDIRPLGAAHTAETFAGIALVKSAVDGISEAISTARTSVRLLTSWTSCSPANNRSKKKNKKANTL